MSFDLDAAVAAESGAQAPFEFTYKNQSFSIPLAVPVSVIRKLKNIDADDLDGVLQTLLGPSAGAFLALDPLDTEIKILMDEYAKAKGVSLGEASK